MASHTYLYANILKAQNNHFSEKIKILRSIYLQVKSNQSFQKHIHVDVKTKVESHPKRWSMIKWIAQGKYQSFPPFVELTRKLIKSSSTLSDDVSISFYYFHVLVATGIIRGPKFNEKHERMLPQSLLHKIQVQSALW